MGGVTTRRQALRVLELPDTAGPADVRRAFRSLAKRYHPDKHPDIPPDRQAALDNTMKEIIEAARFLSGKTGAQEPLGGPDFLSTLRTITPDGPHGVRTPVSSRRERELEDRQRQGQDELAKKAAAQKLERENAAKKQLLQAELRGAAPEVRPYLLVFHGFASDAPLDTIKAGFVSHAAKIAAIRADPDKKTAAMHAVCGLFDIGRSETMVSAVSKLCAASEKDNTRRFRLITQALQGLAIFYSDDYVSAYSVVSSLDDRNIAGMGAFVSFLREAGITILRSSELEQVLTATLAQTPDLLAVTQKTSLRAHIDPRSPVSSYVEAIPLVFSGKGSGRARRSAQMLSQFWNGDKQEKAEQVFRRLVKAEEAMAPLCQIITNFHYVSPFRESDPLDSYESIETLYEKVIQAGVPDKLAIRFVTLVGKTARTSSPADVVGTAITFFGTAREKGLQPDVVWGRFKSFFTQSRALGKGSLSWTSEMQAAYREIRDGSRPGGVNLGFKQSMGIILKGFYSAYP